MFIDEIISDVNKEQTNLRIKSKQNQVKEEIGQFFNYFSTKSRENENVKNLKIKEKICFE